MHAKHNDPRKHKQGVPSTGNGAASAMVALIQKRMPAPGSGIAPQPQQQQPKHGKKH
jgi:hypothetical protein